VLLAVASSQFLQPISGAAVAPCRFRIVCIVIVPFPLLLLVVLLLQLLLLIVWLWSWAKYEHRRRSSPPSSSSSSWHPGILDGIFRPVCVCHCGSTQIYWWLAECSYKCMYTGHGIRTQIRGIPLAPRKLCVLRSCRWRRQLQRQQQQCNNGAATDDYDVWRGSTLLTRLGGINSNGFAVVKLPRAGRHAQLQQQQQQQQPAAATTPRSIQHPASSGNNSSYRYSCCPKRNCSKTTRTTMTRMANNCKLWQPNNSGNNNATSNTTFAKCWSAVWPKLRYSPLAEGANNNGHTSVCSMVLSGASIN